MVTEQNRIYTHTYAIEKSEPKDHRATSDSWLNFLKKTYYNDYAYLRPMVPERFFTLVLE
jgi:hypothetical protein